VFRDPHGNHEAAHDNGLHWTNRSLGALFVPYYNRAIRSIASAYGDVVLDAYRLSNLYLETFEETDVRVHIDSLHYCPGSLYRSLSYLLQEVLRLRILPPSHNNNSNSNDNLYHHRNNNNYNKMQNSISI
jgi:hypothetical protein